MREIAFIGVCLRILCIQWVPCHVTGLVDAAIVVCVLKDGVDEIGVEVGGFDGGDGGGRCRRYG